MKRSIFLTVRLLFVYNILFSQSTGSVTGTITDSSNGDPLPFCTIVLFQDSIPKFSDHTDFNGAYYIPLVDSGDYDIKIEYIGYGPKLITGFHVFAGMKNQYSATLSPNTTEIESVEVVTHKRRFISQDKTTSGTVLTSKEIRAMPTRDVSTIAQMGASTYNRGSRSSSSITYINGVKVAEVKGYTPIRHVGVSRKQRQKLQQQQPNNNQVQHIQKFNTESYQALEDNHFKYVTDEPFSTFSIDVDNASYTNVRRMLNNHQKPPIDAIRIEEFINYFDYSYEQPTDTHPFSIHTEIGPCSWNPDAKLLKIGLKGKEEKFDESKPLNLVFLLDVSGSMTSYNKLPWVKKSISELIPKLREKDRVSMVVYAGAAGQVLEPTPGNKKEKIFNALNMLEAGGSTAGGQGLRLAYQLAEENYDSNAVNRIILATDGDFNIGVSSDAEMQRIVEQEREKGIFITVLGYGMGNYKDSKMEIIANKGNGNYFYIDRLEEARRILSEKLTSTLVTIAKDVKIQLEFNPMNIESYRLVGYSNRKLNKEDFNNDQIDAGELGPGHTVTALYEIVFKNKLLESPKEVDEMRYQKRFVPNEELSHELFLVKLRYKKPDGKKSIYLDKVIDKNMMSDSDSVSEDFIFCSAVAEFGLFLRNSKYGNSVKLKDILRHEKSLGALPDDRKEFFHLVKKSQKIKDLAME